MEKDLNDEIRIIKEERNKQLIDILAGETLPEDITSRSGEIVLQDENQAHPIRAARAQLDRAEQNQERLQG